jgi:hypothetical protein
MYVAPEYQNKGFGKILLQKALLLARDCNYQKVKLDTLNYMSSAIHLYKQAGFYEIPPYYSNPISTAVYFEIDLASFFRSLYFSPKRGFPRFRLSLAINKIGIFDNNTSQLFCFYL